MTENVRGAETAATGRRPDPLSEDGRLGQRRAHDADLEAESTRILLGVVRGRHLTPLPQGLPPLVAALIMAANAGGARVDPGRARGAVPPTGEVPGVDELAALLRVPIRRVTLSGPWWREAALPRLAFVGGQPFALVPRGRHYVARDATGRSFPVRGPVANTVEPTAYAIYPRLPHRAVRSRDLLRLALTYSRWDLLALAGLTIVLAAVSAVFPYATAQIVGVVIPSGSRGALAYVLISLGVFTVVLLLASIGQALLVLGLSSRASARLTAAIWDRLLHLPSSFLRGHSTGEVAAEVTAFDQMRALITSSLVGGLVGSALALGGLGVLLSISAPVAAAELCILVIASLAGWWIIRRYDRWLDQAVQERNRLNGLLLGLFAGIAKLRVAGAERRSQALWAHDYAFQQQTQRAAAIERVRLTVLQTTMPGLLLLGAIAVLGELSIHAVGVASFAGAVAASSQVAVGAAAIVTVAVTVAQLRPLYHSAQPILDTAPEIPEATVPPGEIRGRLELSAVTFGYAPGRPVLRQVSFDIPAGSFVAIVGPSGAGKSTLLRLLLGFESPSEGEILLDGKSLQGLDLEAVRRRMGTVIQGAQVNAGSLLTNIVGSLPLGTDAAWQAAEQAGIAADIRAMPMGMSTVVSEGGAGFSGGQLQRILLARALVRNPRILLLDEATSQLDNTTQRIVSDNLSALGVTRVVVAHRLSTVRHADRIIVLQDGGVAECGTYEELLAGAGPFAQLAQRQTL